MQARSPARIGAWYSTCAVVHVLSALSSQIQPCRELPTFIVGADRQRITNLSGPHRSERSMCSCYLPLSRVPCVVSGKKDDGDIQSSSCYEDHPALIPLLTSNWLNQPANWISLCPKHQEICHKLKGLDPKIDDPVLAS